MTRTSRMPATLADSLHRQLSSYALAASAAGVGLLSLSKPAQAGIIYTPSHRVIHGTNANPKPVPLSLTHDGGVEFEFLDAWFVDEDFGPTGWLTIFPVHSLNGVEGHTVNSGTLYDSALTAGARVGPSVRFYPNISNAAMCGAHVSSRSALWCGVRGHYLGLKFAIKGKIHYGWARLDIEVDKRAHITATLTGYAYETIPNKPIVAGKTHGPDVIMVRDASLGHLAQGASAIPAWRRSK